MLLVWAAAGVWESEREETERKRQNESGGAEGVKGPVFKKERDRERGGDRGRNTTRGAERLGEKREGVKRVTSSRAASAHGAGGEVVGK